MSPSNEGSASQVDYKLTLIGKPCTRCEKNHITCTLGKEPKVVRCEQCAAKAKKCSFVEGFNEYRNRAIKAATMPARDESTRDTPTSSLGPVSCLAREKTRLTIRIPPRRAFVQEEDRSVEKTSAEDMRLGDDMDAFYLLLADFLHDTVQEISNEVTLTLGGSGTRSRGDDGEQPASQTTKLLKPKHFSIEAAPPLGQLYNRNNEIVA
ncbi:hypothetical protein HYDPIDRAFT_171144 [Hydnomerulius pinastri MD-312]|uniref:Unplaced genomic scaffold scaffold_78, whole genome shotgun sequence n=1 Tax=Hydnomerulius pinastri MD-312 TaxID=994086 RepID=A0A0C9W843_9AGAM|nr:hypothetical protein HYDPIDRAFT_171144 [Hydnomerulius pinastri MD-312]